LQALPEGRIATTGLIYDVVKGDQPKRETSTTKGRSVPEAHDINLEIERPVTAENTQSKRGNIAT
jgi:hypothetical protein